MKNEKPDLYKKSSDQEMYPGDYKDMSSIFADQ